MIRRALDLAPVLVTMALIVLFSRSAPTAGALGIALALAALLHGRWTLAPSRQRALVVLVGAAAALLAPVLLPAALDDRRSLVADAWGRLAFAAVAVLSLRRVWRDPDGGGAVDLGLVAAAVAACGQGHVGGAYLPVAVLAVALATASMRARMHELDVRSVEGRSVGALFAVLATSAGLASAGMVALPWLQRTTQRQFDRMILSETPSSVDFGGSLGTTPFVPSAEPDEVLLRLRGPHTDYLRGRVFDSFDGSRWESAGATSVSTVATPRGDATAAGTTEVEAAMTGDAPPGRGRFFLPAGARGVGTPTGSALVDAYGVLLPARDEAATTVWFSGQGGVLPVAPPGPRDLDIPPRLRSVLEPIASEWTVGETTSEGRLAAILRHLASGFSYSLDVPGSRGTSPVMDFLLVTRRGHCSLFATAMALLGRAAGVPVRVVGGFRVAEHNAIGGYDVVRAKNAHAWVEAWTPERGWQTFDPTPVTEDNLRREERGFGAIADAVRGAVVRALSRIRGAGAWRPILVLALAIPALALLVRLSARRLRSRRRPAPPADAPPAYFTAFERTLAARGCPRAPGEPLERYAARLRDASLASAADVVLDYAAHRYGGIGDASAIEARARACAGDAERR